MRLFYSVGQSWKLFISLHTSLCAFPVILYAGQMMNCNLIKTHVCEMLVVMYWLLLLLDSSNAVILGKDVSLIISSSSFKNVSGTVSDPPTISVIPSNNSFREDYTTQFVCQIQNENSGASGTWYIRGKRR